MAHENRTELKAYFETGDVPTQQEFEMLIDSVINIKEDEIYIDGSKNVGIGIQIPQKKLDVTGMVRATGFTLGGNDLGGHEDVDGAFYRTGGQVYLTVDDNLYIRDSVSQATKMHFDTTNGRLGIGEENPSHLLQVTGDSGGDYQGVASILIGHDPQGGGNRRSAIFLGDKEHYIEVQEGNPMKFHTYDNFLFDWNIPWGDFPIPGNVAKIEIGDDQNYLEVANGGPMKLKTYHRFVLENENPSITADLLHVKGVSGMTTASILIEPGTYAAAGHGAKIKFANNDHYIEAQYANGMKFYDSDKFFFDGGNVGIGTDSPNTALHLRGTAQMLRLQDLPGLSGPLQDRDKLHGYIEFRDYSNRRKGYIGYGSKETNIFSFVNEIGGIKLKSSYPGKIEIESTQGDVDINSYGNINFITNSQSKLKINQNPFVKVKRHEKIITGTLSGNSFISDGYIQTQNSYFDWGEPIVSGYDSNLPIIGPYYLYTIVDADDLWRINYKLSWIGAPQLNLKVYLTYLRRELF